MNYIKTFFQKKSVRFLTLFVFFGALLTQVIQSQNQEKPPAKGEQIFHSSKSITPPGKSKKPKPQEVKETKSSKAEMEKPASKDQPISQEQSEKKIPKDDLKKFPIHPSSKAPDFEDRLPNKQ